MYLRLTFLIGALLFVTSGLVGCERLKRNLATSEIGVDEFHTFYNQRKFEEIYWTADSRFRDETTLEEWLPLVGSFRENYGKVVASKTVGFSVNWKGDQFIVRLQKHTEYVRGNATEQFVFTVSGDVARLLGYKVSP
jgi:hypothetical protein